MIIRGLHLGRAKPKAAAWLALLALALAGQQAGAQDTGGSVGDFRLPPGTERPAAPAQGPVDDQVPNIRPTRSTSSEPTAAPSPAPTASASVAPANPAASAPAAERQARSAPTPDRNRQTEPLIPSGQTSDQAVSVNTVPAESAASPAASVTSQAAVPLAPAASKGSGEWPVWAYLLAGIVVLGGMAAMVLLRRQARPEAIPERQRVDEAARAVPAPVRPAEPLAVPPPPTPNVPPEPAISTRSPDPVRPPAPVRSSLPPVSLDLQARQLSRSLVYVTLAYRLTITNQSATAIGPLRVAADLASAHASKSQDAQLRPPPGALEQRHTAQLIAPGESQEFSGELRLPVSSILAIQQGVAQLFVPLVRLLIEAGSGQSHPFVFVVGQAGETPGAALRPFRIDAMPSVFRDLSQREIAIAA